MDMTTKQKTKVRKYAREIAKEEAGNFFKENEKPTLRQRRALRRKIIERVLEDKKAEKEYGFIGIGWLLAAALAGVISWVVKRWLDKIFPEEE